MKRKGSLLKVKPHKSGAFKSVTFNVTKTLNDSHSVFIQINSRSYYPGDTVNGYVYLNFTDNLPSESVDLIISGYEETNFTLKLQTDEKEHERHRKIFGKKVFLLQSEEQIKAGEYVFPFQFMLPKDIPASVIYQDLYCNAAVKYEISLSIISKNKEQMDDILAKKMVYVYERKRDFEDNQKNVANFKKEETCADSNLNWSAKDKLLSGDFFKISIEKELEDNMPKTEFYEYIIVYNSCCCFSPKSVILNFTLQCQNILIGEPFQIINKIKGFKDIDYINYGLYREIKCEASPNKIYSHKTLIEQQEIDYFQKNCQEMTAKINFPFKGTPEIKITRMPSSHGTIVSCKYYVGITVQMKGCYSTRHNYKIPIHVSGEADSLSSQKSIYLENQNLEEDFKSMAHPVQLINI